MFSHKLLSGSRRILSSAGISLESFSSVRSAAARQAAANRTRISSSKRRLSTSTESSSSSSSTNSPPFWSNEFEFFKKTRRWVNMNLSDICGNASSVLVLCAYSMSDILALRVTSICATLLSLCFQYYRATPLWIPIRWNTVLLSINTAMVTMLYLERRRANHMSPELEVLYKEGKFERRGFSRVEFLRLQKLAETVTLPAGHVLVKQGQVKKSLHFIVDGQVRVSTNEGEVLAMLDKYHFIGEISLLSRIAQDFDTAASADVTLVKNTTFLKWDFEKLEPYLKSDREVFNALSAYFNYDLTQKLLRDGQIQKVPPSIKAGSEPKAAASTAENKAVDSKKVQESSKNQ